MSQACPCHFASSWLQLLRFQHQQPIINLLRKPKWESRRCQNPPQKLSHCNLGGLSTHHLVAAVSLRAAFRRNHKQLPISWRLKRGPGRSSLKTIGTPSPPFISCVSSSLPRWMHFSVNTRGQDPNTNEASIPTLHSPLEDVKLLPARLCKLDQAGRECMLDKLLNRVWLHAKHTTEAEQPTNQSHIRLALTGLTDRSHRSWGRPPVKLADLRPEINFADRILSLCTHNS